MSHEVDPVYGCHLSTNRLDHDGYAYHGKSRAHIVAWELEHGPVPDGMYLDHRCRRRNCTNVDHLEMVTQSENERRKRWKVRARWTKCPNGHDLTLYKVITPEGGVTCRACTRGSHGMPQEKRS